MVHVRQAVLGAVTSLTFAGVGYAMWSHGSRGGPWHDVRDEGPAATRSAPVAPASHPRSRLEATTQRAPVVSFRDGLLTVRAAGTPLNEVLAAITESAGVRFVPRGEVGEKVWIDLGPRPLREVVSGLLERASYGYAFVDVPGGTGRPAAMQVFLIKRESAGDVHGQSSMERGPAAARGFAQGEIDTRSPPPDESALKQQRAVDAMFDACKAQACDSS